MNNLDKQPCSSPNRLTSKLHPDSLFFGMLLRAPLIFWRRWR